jgi:hypothetical protein
MTQQAPTFEEIQAAVAFLKKRGRNVNLIPGDKAGLYKIDGHISTRHDVVRHAFMAGWKLLGDVGACQSELRTNRCRFEAGSSEHQMATTGLPT